MIYRKHNILRKKIKFIIVIIFLYQSTSIFSQTNKNNISFEIRYPITFGDINDRLVAGNKYLGVVDFGVGYNVLKFNNLGVGINFNTSFLQLSSTNLTILSPKIKAEYFIKQENITVIPQLAIGYANWRLRDSEMLIGQLGDPDRNNVFKQNENGLVIKAATKLVLNSTKKVNWYFQLAYELTKLEEPGNIANEFIFDGTMQILYPGIGIIWNIKNEDD